MINPPISLVLKYAFGYDFSELRQQTFEWLKMQDLLMFFINAGGIEGLNAVILLPKNAAHFAFALALLQGILDSRSLSRRISN